MEDKAVCGETKPIERAPTFSTLGLDKTRPLTDELAAGHLGRFQMLGDLTTRAATLRRLRSLRTRSVPTKKQDGALLVLADTCGIEREAYVRSHSLLPFLCFINRNARVQSSNGFWEHTVISLVGLRSPRPRAYICATCVRDDVSRRGYSYWRRAHQLPGVHWCEQHGDPLLSTQALEAFDQMPSSCMASATPGPKELVHRANPMVDRFVAIVRWMLAGGRSWPIETVRAGLLAKAEDLQLRLAPPGNRPVLSDLAIAALPLPLIEELVPGASQKERGKYLSAIDGALASSGGTPVSVAIALTILFDTTEEAMRACCPPAATA